MGKENYESNSGILNYNKEKKQSLRNSWKVAAAALSTLLADAMLQFLLGFTFGNVVGMYLAQNYDIPNLAKKLEEIKKDLDAKKKPPSS